MTPLTDAELERLGRLTDAELEELEVLEKDATPAPLMIQGAGIVYSGNGAIISDRDMSHLQPKDGLLFIAARNALPRLLSEIRARRVKDITIQYIQATLADLDIK